MACSVTYIASLTINTVIALCVALPTNVRLPLKNLQGTANIVKFAPTTVPKKTEVFKYLDSG